MRMVQVNFMVAMVNLVFQIQYLKITHYIELFINAGIEAGYPYNEDLNGANQEGFGPAQQTIWKGKRESTGQSFIKPTKNRKNLVPFLLFQIN